MRFRKKGFTFTKRRRKWFSLHKTRLQRQQTSKVADHRSQLLWRNQFMIEMSNWNRLVHANTKAHLLYVIFCSFHWYACCSCMHQCLSVRSIVIKFLFRYLGPLVFNSVQILRETLRCGVQFVYMWYWYFLVLPISWKQRENHRNSTAFVANHVDNDDIK